MQKIINRISSLLLTLFLLLSVVTGCGRPPAKHVDQGFDLFDSYYVLTVYTDSEEDFARYAALCRDELMRWHQLLDIYNSYEGMVNLNTLNNRADSVVSVNDALFGFLGFSKEMYALTGGYTNLAMGGVIALWQEAKERAAVNGGSPLPSDEALRAALLHTDLDGVTLREGRYVYFSDPLLQLNAGALGKGYAARRVAELLSEAGCSSFLLDVGGSLVAKGSKPDGTEWLAAIRAPEGHAGYEKPVTISGLSLVTSGSYERFVEWEGTRYAHILHPETGSPTHHLVGVSVLSPDPALGDALSTALFSMTEEDGQALIASLADTEAVWLFADGRTVVSNGFEAVSKGGLS